MKIAVVKETFAGEHRVALVPSLVPPLLKLGAEVWVEHHAGMAAGYPDEEFTAKGAQIAADRASLFDADILLGVRWAGANPNQLAADVAAWKSGQVVIGMADPLGEPAGIQTAAEAGISFFGLELIPRITRAQSMDVLSSMATVAGYRAVLLSAVELPRMFPLMMTAAGTLSPARVFVIGAGVAGLQAIATSRRLGAVVQAYDVRPAVKEQCESLGAKFVELPLETSSAEGQGGYAKAMDEDFYQRQRQLMAEVVAQSDVVITTAAIPGRRSPLLITKEAVAGMQPGSVIVDLAAERGGNCELAQANQTVVAHGVKILGPTNLPAEVPYHASQMFAKNVVTFLQHLVKKGEVQFNLDDEITRETLMTRNGQVVLGRLREMLELPPLETAKPVEDASAESNKEVQDG